MTHNVVGSLSSKHTRNGHGASGVNNQDARAGHLVPMAFNWQSDGDCRGLEPAPQTSSLTLEQTPAVVFQTRIARNGRGQPKETVDALISSDGGTHADSKPHVAGSFGVRRLTPLECERLQGLPDDWTRYAADGKEISDSARYRMIGNGVAVPCVEWIARRINGE